MGSFASLWMTREELMSKLTETITEVLPRRVFGRRIGRPLGASRQDVIDSMLPALTVPEHKVT